MSLLDWTRRSVCRSIVLRAYYRAPPASVVELRFNKRHDLQKVMILAAEKAFGFGEDPAATMLTRQHTVATS